jgi:hypothetical protein
LLFYLHVITPLTLGIALDQSIECSINKHGKGHGGISGKLSDDSIDVWIHSFSFRAILSATFQEICGIETAQNNMDSHMECSPNRLAADDHDLMLMINNLKREDIFSTSQLEFRKLRSGKIVHADIIDHICSSFERGEQVMSVYIEERLMKKTVGIDEPLKAMPFLSNCCLRIRRNALLCF